MSQPSPPPSVSPAIPVVETAPPVTASSCSPAAALSSAHVTPPSARTVRASGSTRIVLHLGQVDHHGVVRDREPGHVVTAAPDPDLVPAPRAKRTAAATSAASDSARSVPVGDRSARCGLGGRRRSPIAGLQQPPAERRGECVNVLPTERSRRAHRDPLGDAPVTRHVRVALQSTARPSRTVRKTGRAL